MNHDNHYNRSNSNSNRRGVKHNKRYKDSNNKNYNNKSNYQKKGNLKKNNDAFSNTKQQVFDFDEMKFSDDIDTSFVENKRKKKSQIVDELAQSYERKTARERKREKNSHFNVLSVIVFLVIFLVFIGLCGTCFYIFTHPAKVNVVKKEKEVIVLDDNYLFLGDSITEQYDLEKYYPDMNVVNSGIGGNKTSDILKNLKKRVYQYNPSKVFLLIGINDIRSDVKEEEIVQNIEDILSELRKNRPYAELYLESIYPVDENKSGSQTGTNEKIKSINQTLKEYCQNEKITFINIYDLLLDSESDEEKINANYTKDGLHLTDAGYEVVTGEIMRYIK